MKKHITMLAVSGLLTSGCVHDAAQSLERSKLLNSSGPQFTVEGIAGYQTAIDNMRRFYREVQDSSMPTSPIPAAEFGAARDKFFADVDFRCDAYIDAIFWANRTRGGATSANNAIASATEIIVASTGGSARTLAILAAAFGLSGSLFDAYYDSVLYGLNPSGIQKLVDTARGVYKASPALKGTIPTEGALLMQVQGYIRLCTPANIEYLVNEAISTAKVVEKKPEAPKTEAAPVAAARVPNAVFSVAPEAFAPPAPPPNLPSAGTVPVIGVE